MLPAPARSHWFAAVISLALAPGGLLIDARQAQAPPPAAAAVEQRAPATPAPAPAATLDGEMRDADRTRNQLQRLLDRQPPSLRAVLQLDPALAGDAGYLVPYPEVRAFLDAHPEVARNAAFFFGDAAMVERQTDPRALAFRAWERIFETFSIFGVFLTVTGALAWLVRTLVDYRRWQRVSRVQAEAHAKLLDRLTQNDELLTYVQSPAGSAFLSSAPIPLDTGRREIASPYSRILWSVQAGVVLAFGGLGLFWASTRVLPEMASPLSVLGILSLMLGAGFVASAIFAHVLARRLGLIGDDAASAARRAGTLA